MIKIYTDGSCLGNPGNGGWAAIIIYDSKKIRIKEIDRVGMWGIGTPEDVNYFLEHYEGKV